MKRFRFEYVDVHGLSAAEVLHVLNTYGEMGWRFAGREKFRHPAAKDVLGQREEDWDEDDVLLFCKSRYPARKKGVKHERPISSTRKETTLVLPHMPSANGKG